MKEVGQEARLSFMGSVLRPMLHRSTRSTRGSLGVLWVFVWTRDLMSLFNQLASLWHWCYAPPIWSSLHLRFAHQTDQQAVTICHIDLRLWYQCKYRVKITSQWERIPAACRMLQRRIGLCWGVTSDNLRFSLLLPVLTFASVKEAAWRNIACVYIVKRNLSRMQHSMQLCT